MSLNDNKLKLCDKYNNYLKLIYIIGNGVMFKKHVEEFAQKIFDTSRTSAQNILSELRNYDILDYKQYQRAVVIKLKKIALQYLKNCKSEDQKMIKFHGYLTSKLKPDIKVKFRICVSSSVRCKRFDEQADKFDIICKSKLAKCIDYAIKDLNISSLFLNRKIAISAETNVNPILYIKNKP